MSKEVKKIAPFLPTREQREWVDKKSRSNKSIGNNGGTAQVMRDLIQQKIEEEKQR